MTKKYSPEIMANNGFITATSRKNVSAARTRELEGALLVETPDGCRLCSVRPGRDGGGARNTRTCARFSQAVRARAPTYSHSAAIDCLSLAGPAPRCTGATEPVLLTARAGWRERERGGGGGATDTDAAPLSSLAMIHTEKKGGEK